MSNPNVNIGTRIPDRCTVGVNHYTVDIELLRLIWVRGVKNCGNMIPRTQLYCVLIGFDPTAVFLVPSLVISEFTRLVIGIVYIQVIIITIFLN